MTTIAVDFPGESLEDVFIYRSTLYGWTFDRSLRLYSISAIEDGMVKADSEFGAAVAYWLFHDGGLGSTKDQRTARQLAQLPDTYRSTIDLDQVPSTELRFNAEVGSVLDLNAYYDTLYLASDGGMFAVPLEGLGQSDGAIRPSRPVDAPCLSTGAGLGAVTASCGSRGLHVVTESFKSADKPGKRISDVSLRAEVGAQSVINHRSRSEVQFIRASKVRAAASGRGNVITEVAEANVYDPQKAPNLGEPDGYSFWDRARMLQFGPDGVNSVRVAQSNMDWRVSRTHRVVNTSGEQVISACRVDNSFAFETDNAVTILDRAARHTRIETGPVIGLRSYPRSLRYGRVATVTSETGLWFIGGTTLQDSPA